MSSLRSFITTESQYFPGFTFLLFIRNFAPMNTEQFVLVFSEFEKEPLEWLKKRIKANNLMMSLFLLSISIVIFWKQFLSTCQWNQNFWNNKNSVEDNVIDNSFWTSILLISILCLLIRYNKGKKTEKMTMASMLSWIKGVPRVRSPDPQSTDLSWTNSVAQTGTLLDNPFLLPAV